MIRFIIMNIISNHNIYCKSNTLLPAYLLWGQKKVYFSIWLTQHAETSFRNFLSASNQVIFKLRATHLYTQFRSFNCQVATVLVVHYFHFFAFFGLIAQMPWWWYGPCTAAHGMALLFKHWTNDF